MVVSASDQSDVILSKSPSVTDALTHSSQIWSSFGVDDAMKSGEQGRLDCVLVSLSSFSPRSVN